MLHINIFHISNVRFCCQSKKEVSPQILLEERKFEIKKTKMENVINDELEPRSFDESDSETESDNESDNESNHESNE